MHLNQYSLSQVDTQIVRQIVERFGWQPFKEDISPYLTPRRGALYRLKGLLLAQEPLSPEGQSVMTKWVTDLWEPSLGYDLRVDVIANLVQLVALLKIEALPDEIITFLAG